MCYYPQGPEFQSSLLQPTEGQDEPVHKLMAQLGEIYYAQMNDMYQIAQSKKHTVAMDGECRTWLKKRSRGLGQQHGTFCNLGGGAEAGEFEKSGEGQVWRWSAVLVVMGRSSEMEVT